MESQHPHPAMSLPISGLQFANGSEQLKTRITSAIDTFELQRRVA
jgi:hypothetical protein